MTAHPLPPCFHIAGASQGRVTDLEFHVNLAVLAAGTGLHADLPLPYKAPHTSDSTALLEPQLPRLGASSPAADFITSLLVLKTGPKTSMQIPGTVATF